MKNEQIELTGVITDLKRLKNSINGNPRAAFVVDGVIVTTAPNCGFFNYVENHYRRAEAVKVTAKMIRNKLTLTNIEKV